ncbi:MAG: glyoxalase, partial [Christensenella sp.]
FYDPDKHIVEVGENMAVVVKRFIDSGFSVGEVAARMDVTVDYVQSCCV